ncbi:MAG: hypothetical protein ACK56P_03665 [Chitinophagales bacterium]
MKKVILLAILPFLNLVFSCGGTKNLTSTAKAPMNFDYNPPTEGVTKSNEIKFALVNPRFLGSSEEIEQFRKVPYKTFIKNMGQDFQEMLSARGYQTIGPFSSYDEMVYQEKKSSDLVLIPEVSLNFASVKAKTTYNYLLKQDVYQIDGDVTMEGKITMHFCEPFTKTKVWSKSVPIEPVTFYLKSKEKYTRPIVNLEDQGIWNTLVEQLSPTYQKCLKTCWNHLEPTELLIKKKEAAEIKAQSNFQKN